MAMAFEPRGDKVEPSPKVKTWPSSNPKMGPLQNGGGSQMKGESQGLKSAKEIKPILKNSK